MRVEALIYLAALELVAAFAVYHTWVAPVGLLSLLVLPIGRPA